MAGVEATPTKRWGFEEYYGLGSDFDPTFFLTPEDRALEAEIIDACDGVIRPLAIECDRTGEYPRASVDELGRVRLLAIIAPEEYGCRAASHTQVLMAPEAIARDGFPSTAIIFIMHLVAVAGLVFRAKGNPEIESLLRRMDSEALIATASYTDPETGGHFWYRKTSAPSGPPTAGTSASRPPSPRRAATPTGTRRACGPNSWCARRRTGRVWIEIEPNVWFRPLFFVMNSGLHGEGLRVRRDGVLVRHRHPSPVHGYVLKGRWRYLEHTRSHRRAPTSSSPGRGAHAHGRRRLRGDADDVRDLRPVLRIDAADRVVHVEDNIGLIELARERYAANGPGADFVDQFIR
jgi:hypothetical protein